MYLSGIMAEEGAGDQNDFYVRYYVGHKGIIEGYSRIEKKNVQESSDTSSSSSSFVPMDSLDMRTTPTTKTIRSSEKK